MSQFSRERAGRGLCGGRCHHWCRDRCSPGPLSPGRGLPRGPGAGVQGAGAHHGGEGGGQGAGAPHEGAGGGQEGAGDT